MMRFIHVRRVAGEGPDRVGTVWRTVRAQPGWVHRWAGTFFLLVLALPILLFALLALLVAVIVFIVLATLNAVLRTIRSLLPRRDGRRNVRVVTRPPTGP